jgi:hypothetical protein
MMRGSTSPQTLITRYNTQGPQELKLQSLYFTRNVYHDQLSRVLLWRNTETLRSGRRKV